MTTQKEVKTLNGFDTYNYIPGCPACHGLVMACENTSYAFGFELLDSLRIQQSVSWYLITALHGVLMSTFQPKHLCTSDDVSATLVQVKS